MSEKFVCLSCGAMFDNEDETWLHRRDLGHTIDLTVSKKRELIAHYRKLEEKAVATGQTGAEILFREKREKLEKEI